MIACDEELVAQNVQKGVLFFLGTEFTLRLDPKFAVSHREEFKMFVELVKRLKQRTFDDRRSAWHIPVAADSIRCLHQFVGWGITPTKDALAQLALQLKKQAALDALTQAATEDHVDLVIPGAENTALNAAMKNYQRGGVKFMLTVERSYNGDEMGLGKSLQLLALLELKGAYPALILCPVTLKQNWLAECRKWVPHRTASVLANSLAAITIMGYSEAHKYCNYQLAAKGQELKLAKSAAQAGQRFFYPDLARPVAIACDEGHWIKNSESRRTQVAITLATVCEAKVRVVMSGTPLENGTPEELIAPLTFLGQLDAMGGWMNFVIRYCGGRRTRFGWDKTGASNTKELHDRLARLCYIRRKKHEVLKELPAKIQSVYEVEIDNRAHYDRIAADVIVYMMEQRARLVSKEESDARAMIKLGLLRHAVGLGKVEWIAEWVDNFLASGEKFVLYATHREVQHRLVERLAKWNPATVLGGCPDVNKEVEKFVRDKSCRLFIGSMLAAGFGINGLQGVASHIGIAELMWTDSKHQQAIDRLHRIGQTDCVNAYFFIARDTVDDQVWEVVSEKVKLNSSTVDGVEASDTPSAAQSAQAAQRFFVSNQKRN